MLAMSKVVDAKRKLKESQQYRAISWLSKLGKWVAYLALAIVVLTMAAPMIAMNYISTQIKSGEWGADFKPKTTVEEVLETSVKGPK